MQDRAEDYLKDNERSLLATALRAAAERWDEWAVDLCVREVKETFAKQAQDARALATRIDEANDVMVL